MKKYLVIWRSLSVAVIWQASEVLAGNEESAVRAVRPISNQVRVIDLDDPKIPSFATTTTYEVIPR